MPMAQTIAYGTAVAALDASSLMWTLESKEPALEYRELENFEEETKTQKYHAQIVHSGARKLRINAYPDGQSYTEI